MRLASLVCIALWSVTATAATAGAEPAEVAAVNEEEARSGRGWLTAAPGAGSGSLRQIDAGDLAMVGDGQADQGWGYLMAFRIDKAMVEAASDGATIELIVHTAGAVNGGAPGPMRLKLLSIAEEPGRHAPFRAYNTAPDLADAGDPAPGDGENRELRFDIGEAIKTADGLKPDTIAYFILMNEPFATVDGKGQFMQIHATGDRRPRLVVNP